MKRKLLTAAIVCFGTFCMAYSQAGKICKWDNDRKAAVVLTFDDWTPGQYPIAVSELKTRNLNATFFIMLSSIGSWNHPWADVVTTASYGNEIGNHTQTHPNLTGGLPASQLKTEIRDMRDSLNKHVTTQAVMSFAYPYGNFNNQVIDSLKKTGHVVARSVYPSSMNYTYDFAATENDYFQILTYYMDGTKTTLDFFQQVTNVMNGGGLLTYMYHSVDNAQGTYNDNWYAKVLQDSLKKQLDALVSVKKRVWVTTLGQAVKYHREARCASIAEISAFNGQQRVIDLTDTLSNNSVYNQPLSIKVKKNGVNYTQILQNNKVLTIDSVFNDTIMFRAIPDGGQIILKGTNLTLNKNVKTEQEVKIYPVPLAFRYKSNKVN